MNSFTFLIFLKPIFGQANFYNQKITKFSKSTKKKNEISILSIFEEKRENFLRNNVLQGIVKLFFIGFQRSGYFKLSRRKKIKLFQIVYCEVVHY